MTDRETPRWDDPQGQLWKLGVQVSDHLDEELLFEVGVAHGGNGGLERKR